MPWPPPQGPHLAEISTLAVLHGQQWQVIWCELLHPFRDITGSHHIGMVQSVEQKLGKYT